MVGITMSRAARLCLLIGFATGLALFAGAQGFNLSWYKIAGGGGTSTGSNYSLSGTIGQPDAGHMAGGNYTIDGGFWGIFAAVQTPGAPFLSVTSAIPKVIVSWPSASTGFRLLQNSAINTTNWTVVTNPVVATNNLNTVTLTPTNGTPLFFRLISP